MNELVTKKIDNLYYDKDMPVRTSKQKKQQLLESVFRDQMKIKKASSLLDIVYPTAKNIIARYRKKMILKKTKRNTYYNQNPCNFRKRTNEDPPIQIIVTKAGKEEWIVDGRQMLTH